MGVSVDCTRHKVDLLVIFLNRFLKNEIKIYSLTPATSIRSLEDDFRSLRLGNEAAV